ncbi:MULTISPECIES: DUF1802 family protein [unclassified Leptolyngbya]|uniref:DUF1802 family protein n=1 Tax=unclassified Leptolyngbya TaxID=2650499 RepID=UPI0016824F69|nr:MULTISPECIES: DUF1802 family protein [unclassified Leptolyngbya]MBD1912400.1 DUF1802 family protein [Leptolyngbya sp. FACHB-8]MBD2154804.1 DUF1802 family protein [Leptolyngbya sp. FACHB-16]
MSEPVLLDRALCLPAADIAALVDGRMIVAIPKMQIQQGWTFALYPCELLDDSLKIEEQYHSSFIELAQASLGERKQATVEMKVWAKCESYKMFYDAEELKLLSQLTVWTEAALHTALKQRGHIFLAYLRVYQLPQPIQVATNIVSPDKFGKFVSLPALDIAQEATIPLRINKLLPVLKDSVFQKRKNQLIELEAPSYPELEELHNSLALLSKTNAAAQELNSEIRALLGWSIQDDEQFDPEAEWIQSIADVGNSSNGNEFERLVRKSLITLGFSNSRNDPRASLNPDAVGGAGGLDVYCDYPYSLVGECKASENESVPNGVSAQLINLGLTHLGKETFGESVKIIFAAGPLTKAAQKAAVESEMNVMRPETLQNLVDLKSQYPGSINLLELKSYLERTPFGEESEEKVNQYIQQVWQRLRVRSHLIQTVKKLAETEQNRRQFEVTEIRVIYNADFASQDGKVLDNETTHEILIELSSPLVGYLGRIQGTSLQSDRFYYLRDLLVE